MQELAFNDATCDSRSFLLIHFTFPTNGTGTPIQSSDPLAPCRVIPPLSVKRECVEARQRRLVEQFRNNRRVLEGSNGAAR